MQTSTIVKLTGTALALGVSWIALRRVIRSYARAKIYYYYELYPDFMGPAIATAENQFVTFATTSQAAGIAVDNLTEELVPILSFNIPSEDSILDFLAQKMVVPLGFPKEKIRLVLDEGVLYAKSETDDQYMKERAIALVKKLLEP